MLHIQWGLFLDYVKNADILKETQVFFFSEIITKLHKETTEIFHKSRKVGVQKCSVEIVSILSLDIYRDRCLKNDVRILNKFIIFNHHLNLNF